MVSATLIAFLATFGITIVQPEFYSVEGLLTGSDIRLSALFLPYGQVIRDEKQIISLRPSSQTAQVVYESDLVKVLMDDRQFAEYNQWVKKDPPARGIPSLAELAASARLDYEKGNYSYPENGLLIGSMLRSGIVSIYNKRIAGSVNFIVVRDYAYICGGWCGSGDWYFLLPDGTVFLEINYMIS